MTPKEADLLRADLKYLLEKHPDGHRDFSQAWQEIVHRFTGIPPSQQRGFTKTAKEANP